MDNKHEAKKLSINEAVEKLFTKLVRHCNTMGFPAQMREYLQNATIIPTEAKKMFIRENMKSRLEMLQFMSQAKKEDLDKLIQYVIALVEIC